MQPASASGPQSAPKNAEIHADDPRTPTSPAEQELDQMLARMQVLAHSLPPERLREAAASVLRLAATAEAAADDSPAQPLRLSFNEPAQPADDQEDRGSVGSLDDEGRVTLEGRASDMIISGGENVYPKEIELVLDAVEGVVESAVIGVPHADFGETVAAVIVDADTPATDEALDQALRSSLARFKHPKQIIRVDALPRNTMGKVQKKMLRELYSAAKG